MFYSNGLFVLKYFDRIHAVIRMFLDHETIFASYTYILRYKHYISFILVLQPQEL